MRTFDVQAVEIDALPDAVFDYVADPRALPEWTHAFESVSDGQAVLSTPAGSATIRLIVHSSAAERTVDWEMRFPTGDTAWAWARVLPHRGGSLMTFVLPAPPVPLEQLEGALAVQSTVLAKELAQLSSRFSRRERPAS